MSLRKRIFTSSGSTDTSSLETRITTLENNVFKVIYYTEINGSTGTITKPTGSTIQLDEFPGGVDAFVSTISSSEPTGQNPTTSGGVIVDVSSFDASGNFTLSGTPSAYPVALIYTITIDASDWSNLTTENIIEFYKNLVFGTTAGTYAEGNDSRFVGDMIVLSGLGLNPADATTYYFGSPFNIAPTTTGDNRRVYIRKACTLIAADVSVVIAGTLGSAGINSTFFIRVNNTTNTNISTTVDHSSAYFVISNTSLSISLVAGDYIEFGWTTGTWGTNPTNVQTTCFLKFQ